MKRKVILEGEIGDRFGREFTINADSFKDVVRCLNSNFPDFHKYLLEADEKDVGFTFQVGESALSDERELFLNYPEGAMVISALPAGSKSGGAKILAAILIVAVIGLSGGFGGNRLVSYWEYLRADCGGRSIRIRYKPSYVRLSADNGTRPRY